MSVFRSPIRPVRLLGAAGLGVLVAGALAAPASAHVEVEADKPQAGATNVTITFTGEAESTTASIVSEQIVLPAGIPADAVTLGKAPAGWKMTPSAEGITIGGTGLKVKQDAVYSIVVAQLPSDAAQLSFKTLETYSNGEVARWIEIPQAGQPEPENPAPTLKLTGATSATPSASAAETPSSSAAETPSSPAPATQAAAQSDDAGSSAGPIIALVAGIVVVVGLAVFFFRRRRGAQ